MLFFFVIILVLLFLFLIEDQNENDELEGGDNKVVGRIDQTRKIRRWPLMSRHGLNKRCAIFDLIFFVFKLCALINSTKNENEKKMCVDCHDVDMLVV